MIKPNNMLNFVFNQNYSKVLKIYLLKIKEKNLIMFDWKLLWILLLLIALNILSSNELRTYRCASSFFGFEFNDAYFFDKEIKIIDKNN